ncbi:MAG: hypothetical protein IJZ93_04595 [Clostridia bacterium]|nr:hypothetical protein [Clostridia bacterium]
MKKKIIFLVLALLAFVCVFVSCGHECTWAEDAAASVAPTCTSNGKKVMKCSECGATQDEIVPSLGGHATQQITVNATCTTEGSITEVCTREGCTYSQLLQTLKTSPHSYEVTDRVEPTCTVKGSEKQVCKVCQFTKTVDVDPNNHNFEAKTTVITPASCLTVGQSSTIDTCTVCGTTQGIAKTAEIPAEGHDIAHSEAYKVAEECVTATCTLAKKEVYKCSKCDYKEEDVGEALGHDIKHENTYLVEEKSATPTCILDGQNVYKCTRCAYEETDVLNKTGHDIKTGDPLSAYFLSSTDATCLTARTETYKCLNAHCDKDETSTQTISVGEALGHDIQTGGNASSPYFKEKVTVETCLNDGVYKYKCLRKDCEYTETKTAADTRTGHDIKTGDTSSAYFVSAVEANCDSPRKETYKCINANCDKDQTSTQVIEVGTKRSHDIPATSELNFKGTVPTEYKKYYHATKEAATCTTDAVYTFKCAYDNCSHTVDVQQTETASGHNVTYDTVHLKETFAPTCVANGYTMYKCTNTGCTYEEKDPNSIVPMTGHTQGGETDRADKTCIKYAYIEYLCTVCGEEYKVEDIEGGLLDHGDWAKIDGKGVTPSTCTAEGYTYYFCTRDTECTVTQKQNGEPVKYDTTPVLDHKFGTSKELNIIRCTVCGTPFYNINYVQKEVTSKEDVEFDTDVNLDVEVTLGKENGVSAMITNTDTLTKEFATDDNQISVIRIISGTDATYVVKVNGNEVTATESAGGVIYYDIIEIETVTSIEITAIEGESGEINAMVDIYQAIATAGK